MEKRMGIYIGKVNVIANNITYYNFKPIYELVNGSYRELSEYDLEELLPESEKREINLNYY